MERPEKDHAGVLILFWTAFLLVLFDVISALLFASLGTAFFPMVQAAMWMTGTFAIVGAGFGLMRARRRGSAVTN
jgi:hypothetical protein